MKHKILFMALAIMLAGAAIPSGGYAATPQKHDANCQEGPAVLPTIEVAAPAYYVLKANYNWKDYQPSPVDRYNPTQMTWVSTFVPGAGQFLTGEYGRGLLFATGSFGLAATAGALAKLGDTQKSDAYYVASLVAAAGSLGLWIWNIIDANHTTKVKNMYLQDILGARCCGKASITMEPSIQLAPGANSTYNPAAGIALKMTF